MGSPLQRKTFVASGAIAAKVFVKGVTGATLSGGPQAQLAVDSAAPIIGVNDAVAIADTQNADIIVYGIADVIFGGTVSAGAYVTSDAAGKAVAPGAVAGTNYHIAGMALVDSVSGDIHPVLLQQHRAQG